MRVEREGGKEGRVMWNDFKIAHFMVRICLWIFIFTNYGENPKKIPTEHKLNQVVK